MEKFTVSRDDSIYEAFPDVALAASGRLVCVFAECTHHADRGYTCVMVTTSDDRGRTWSPKRRLSEPMRGDPKVDPWWNCPRVSALSDEEIYMVNYILDDAPKAQIRGYSVRESDFLIDTSADG